MSESQAEQQKQLTEWRRLSPIAVLYFLFSGLKHFISNFVYILPAFAIGWTSLKESPFIAIPLTLALVSGGVITSLLSYYFYRFRLTSDHVEIRSGVLSKKTVNLPFERIQNVTLEQPIYYRITGYACLLLDTAGSAQQEARIVAMPLDDAQALRKAILHAHNHPTSSTADGTQGAPQTFGTDEQLLNQRNMKDLVLHGLTNNRFWIILGALAPFYDDVLGFLARQAERFGIKFVHVYDPETQPLWEFLMGISVMVVTIVLVMTLASVLGAITIFYGYTLHKAGDRYIRRSGLLTRQEVSMKRSRVQVISSQQDWLDIFLGRFNLYLRQNKTSSMEDPNVTKTDKLLVPSVTAEDRDTITHDVFATCNTSTQGFRRINKRFIPGMLLQRFMPFMLLVAGFGVVVEHVFFLGLAGGLILLFLIALILRWNRWGYRLDEQYLVIRKGFLGVDYHYVPIYKVQQVQMKQSVMMKRRGLATATLVMASGPMSIPYIPIEHCQKLLNLCLYRVEAEQKAWM